MFARSVIAAFVAFPFLVASAQDCARTYTVQAGDDCDSISAKNNASTYQFAAVNPGINSECTNLEVGQAYCLGYSGQDCNTTYIVQSGDDCDAISSAHSMNTTSLMNVNPQIDAQCHNIYVGEVLCVDSSAEVPAPGSSVPASAVPSTATLAIPISSSATPTPPPTSAAAPTSSASADDGDGDDGEDDDGGLPFCDEL